jgi:hypothetical protein
MRSNDYGDPYLESFCLRQTLESSIDLGMKELSKYKTFEIELKHICHH